MLSQKMLIALSRVTTLLLRRKVGENVLKIDCRRPFSSTARKHAADRSRRSCVTLTTTSKGQ